MSVLAQQGKFCIIDLDLVDDMSSAGLRVLMICRKIAANNGSYALCGLQESLRKIMEMAGYLSLLEIYPNRSTAYDATWNRLEG